MSVQEFLEFFIKGAEHSGEEFATYGIDFIFRDADTKEILFKFHDPEDLRVLDLIHYGSRKIHSFSKEKIENTYSTDFIVNVVSDPHKKAVTPTKEGD